MTIPAELLQALAAVTDETGAPLANDKSIKDLVWTGNRLSFTLEMGYPAASRHPAIREALQQFAEPWARIGLQVAHRDGEQDRRERGEARAVVQRQQRDEANQLHRALGHGCIVAEPNGDVLAKGQGRQHYRGKQGKAGKNPASGRNLSVRPFPFRRRCAEGQTRSVRCRRFHLAL